MEAYNWRGEDLVVKESIELKVWNLMILSYLSNRVN